MKCGAFLGLLIFGATVTHSSRVHSQDWSDALESVADATVLIEWKDKSQPPAVAERLYYYDSLLKEGADQKLPLKYMEALRASKAVASNVSKANSSSITYSNGTLVSDNGLVIAPVLGDNHGENTVLVDYGGKKHDAKLLLVDERCKLCVLKIDVSEAKFIGEMSDSMRIGSSVANVSTALDGTTVAATGIVAALDRRITPKYPPMMQTDITVDVGSSGSPFVDRQGRLAGILVAKADIKSAGMSFAVPSEFVGAMLQDVSGKETEIDETIRLKRAFLGVQLKDNDDSGVTVQAVLPKSAAEKAGIQSGDKILAVNETEVGSPDETITLLSKQTVGNLVRIKILRDGMEFEIPASLGRRNEEVVLDTKPNQDEYVYSRVVPNAYYNVKPQAPQKATDAPYTVYAYPNSGYSLQVQRADSDKQIAALTDQVGDLKAEVKQLKKSIAELLKKLEENQQEKY